MTQVQSKNNSDSLFESLGNLGDEDGKEGDFNEQLIEDRNTANLIANFYKSLMNDGIPPALAMRLTVDYYLSQLSMEAAAQHLMQHAQFYDEDDE